LRLLQVSHLTSNFYQEIIMPKRSSRPVKTTPPIKSSAVITLPKWRLQGDSEIDVAYRLINIIMFMGDKRTLTSHGPGEQMLSLVFNNQLSAEIIITKVPATIAMKQNAMAIAIKTFPLSVKDPRVEFALDFIKEQQSRMKTEQIAALNSHFFE
jgi:hypothetical protein